MATYTFKEPVHVGSEIRTEVSVREKYLAKDMFALRNVDPNKNGDLQKKTIQLATGWSGPEVDLIALEDLDELLNFVSPFFVPNSKK